MKQKRILPVIIAAFMAVVLSGSVGLSVYAVENQTDNQETTTTTNESTTTTENSNSSTTSEASRAAAERAREQARHNAEVAAEKAKDAAEKAKEAAEQAAEKAKEEVNAAKEKEAEAKDELKGDRLKACEARQSEIQTIMRNAGDRGQQNIDTFTTITQKVEAFYVSKGKTLTNYAQLVADVNAKKATAQAAVNTVKAAVVQFDCNGTNPKGAIEVFKAELKAQETAMQAYRASVKNLIVGVKSVQDTTTGTGN